MEPILDIWLEASTRSHDFIEKDFWKSKVSDMRRQYLPASETYVYEDDESIKGFVSLHDDTLAAIFVAPKYQGRGIGRRLMAKSMELRGSLDLTVYKQNTRSLEFYLRCGFLIRREQIDLHTGHPELLMVFNPRQDNLTQTPVP